MVIKTVSHAPYSPNFAPCDFWLFPNLRGRRYEIIEEMKEAVTKVIDTLTQEDFHGAFQKLLERYNKCIAAGGDYTKEELRFMCVLSIKVPIRKKDENFRMHLECVCVCVCVCMFLLLCVCEQCMWFCVWVNKVLYQYIYIYIYICVCVCVCFIVFYVNFFMEMIAVDAPKNIEQESLPPMINS